MQVRKLQLTGTGRMDSREALASECDQVAATAEVDALSEFIMFQKLPVGLVGHARRPMDTRGGDADVAVVFDKGGDSPLDDMVEAAILHQIGLD